MNSFHHNMHAGEKKKARTIETEVLGEGLSQGDLVAIANKVPHSKGVLVRAATGKALVSHIKEAKQFPFLFGGIAKGRFVVASRKLKELN